MCVCVDVFCPMSAWKVLIYVFGGLCFNVLWCILDSGASEQNVILISPSSHLPLVLTSISTLF